MANRIDIALELQLHGDPVEENALQPIRIILSSNSDRVGEPSDVSHLPFSANCLSTILRVLEVYKSDDPACLFPNQVDELQNKLGILKGELPLNEKGWKEVTLNNIKHERLQKKMAKKLFSTLFPDRKLRTALEILQTEGDELHIQLKLPSDTETEQKNDILSAYPWELLTYPDSDLFKKPVFLSRYITFEQAPPRPPILSQLNILVITARPKGLRSGDEKDITQIQIALRTAVSPKKIQIDVVPQGTFQALIEHLSNLSEEERPHVLHFDGHGKFGRKCTGCGEVTTKIKSNTCECGETLGEYEGFLAFENTNTIHWVSASIFENLISEYHISFIFLNACRAGRAGSDIFNGVAQRLTRSIPAVVATPFSLDWETAIESAGYFYKALISTGSLTSSMDSVRKILLADTEQHKWYRLALYLRWKDNEGGQLFTPVSENTGASQELDSYKYEIQRYRTKLSKELSADAENAEKKSLLNTDYIENYIRLNASFYWGSDPHDAAVKESEDLITILHNCKYKRVLVMGEAGSGKTVALKYFAWELTKNNPKAIPVIINLGDCGDEGIESNVLYELQRYGDFKSFKNISDVKELSSKDVDYYFLFDGLNEISPLRQQEILKNINDFLLTCIPYLAVITSRPQNRSIKDLSKIDRRFMLTTLRKKQIKTYLFDIEPDARIYALANIPTVLTFIKNMTDRQKALVTNQSQIFTTVVQSLLEEQIEKHIAKRDKWDALRCLAFSLHKQHKVSTEYDDAIDTLVAQFKITDEKASDTIQAIIHHGLMKKESGRYGIAILRFAPNLMMQEYFAAEELKKIATEERKQPLLKMWQKFLDEPDRLTNAPSHKRMKLLLQHSELAYLACDPWWTETFILFAGLLSSSEEESLTTDWLIRKLALSWGVRGLAFLCVEGGAEIQGDWSREFTASIAKDLENSNSHVRYKTVKELLVGIYPQYPFPSQKRIELLLTASEDDDPQVAELAQKGLQLFPEQEVKNLEANQRLPEKNRFVDKIKRTLHIHNILFNMMRGVGTAIGYTFNLLHFIVVSLDKVTAREHFWRRPGIAFVIIGIVVGGAFSFLNIGSRLLCNTSVPSEINMSLPLSILFKDIIQSHFIFCVIERGMSSVTEITQVSFTHFNWDHFRDSALIFWPRFVVIGAIIGLILDVLPKKLRNETGRKT